MRGNSEGIKKVFAIVLCVISLASTDCLSQDKVPQLASAPLSFARHNLIKNGDFVKSLDGWLTVGPGPNSYHPEDTGRADFKIENGMLRVAIRDQGISIWSIMVYQSVMFEKGARYRISFRARSDSEAQIISNVTQDVTWTNFSGDRTFKLTKAMAEYSYQFTMSEPGPALVQFCLGKAGTPTIYLDDVVVRKL